MSEDFTRGMDRAEILGRKISTSLLLRAAEDARQGVSTRRLSEHELTEMPYRIANMIRQAEKALKADNV